MLIRFVVENFKSFKKETEFNLLTGSVNDHPEHIHCTKQEIEVLPTGVIYGGNASGKSNLIEAIFRARNIIVDGTKTKNDSFLISKFSLDNNCISKPTKFEFEFVTPLNTYAYGIAIDYDKVIEEWLYLIVNKEEDIPLFVRNGKEITFDNSLTKDKRDKIFLENEVRGLRINQLFLAESSRRNIGFFEDVYDWFQQLMIVFPEQKFGKLNSFFNPNLLSFSNQLLKLGDAGITIKTVEQNYANLINKYPNIREEVEMKFAYIKQNGLSFLADKEVFTIYFDQAKKRMQAVRLVALHKAKDGTLITFKLPQESDGTQRLIDLSAAVYSAIYENRVVIIDELDRSIHSLLSKKILEIFLKKRIELAGTGQLIFTTHEDLVLDMKVLRSDEIWFMQRTNYGESELYPLSDFNIEGYNLDVRMGYLNGRFGAIPDLRDGDLLQKSA